MDEKLFELAACATLKNRSIFYSKTPEDEAAAKRYCEQCPIEQQCLVEAVIRDETGIWGGTTREERNGAQTKTILADATKQCARSAVRLVLNQGEITGSDLAEHHKSSDRIARLALRTLCESGFLERTKRSRPHPITTKSESIYARTHNPTNESQTGAKRPERLRRPVPAR